MNYAIRQSNKILDFVGKKSRQASSSKARQGITGEIEGESGIL